MPETIDTLFVQQYQNTMRLLCQQKDSRLEGTALPPVKMEGENLYWERLAPSEAIALEGRHIDTPNIEQTHSRRKSVAQPYVWSTLLDRQDAMRLLVDPKGAYQEAARNAMRRRKDRLILAALGGVAYEGKTGTTAVALPNSQKIAHGSAGMTLAKLMAAKEILDAAEAPEERYIVLPAKGITGLLGETEVTSADYNTIRALVKGEIDTFLGFKFIRTELIYLENGSTASTWYAYAYAKGAVGLGVLEDITVRLDERPDKNYAWQAYVAMDMGAVRIEDAMVVEIACYTPTS